MFILYVKGVGHPSWNSLISTFQQPNIISIPVWRLAWKRIGECTCKMRIEMRKDKINVSFSFEGLILIMYSIFSSTKSIKTLTCKQNKPNLTDLKRI